MDFFKSVFSNDQGGSNPQKFQKSMADPCKNQDQSDEEEKQRVSTDNSRESSPRNPNFDQYASPNYSSMGAWSSFGGLIKTFTSTSEQVLQTYRRDLEEFRTGLKKETATIREVASRAVKDLPGSIEIGASVAQESLESVGQVIDDIGSSVWRGTNEILAQGKDALLSVDQDDSSDVGSVQNFSYGSSSIGQNPKRYSRFEALVHSVQVDQSTYTDEPEDLDDFSSWKLGFSLEEKGEEIHSLCAENEVIEGFILKLVPRIVDYETFWSRYFYRIHKIKQAEDARANLVKRAISTEEEDLSWEVDDEEIEISVESKIEANKVAGNEESEKIGIQKNNVEDIDKAKEVNEGSAKTTEIEIQKNVEEMAIEKKPTEVESRALEEVGDWQNSEILEIGEEENSDSKNGALGVAGKPISDDGAGFDDKTFLEVKTDPGESNKDSDFSVVSSQQSLHEEDDLGWDEIEDLGSSDEKKATGSGSPVKVEELRKRLSAPEEDEDLSWDIEDDDAIKT